jgi:hypothetical protein
MASHETRDFTPVVQVSLPCDTKAGDMFAALHLVGNDKQYSDGATFMTGSTPLPASAAGLIGTVLVIGIIGFAALRSRRRRLPELPKSPIVS